MPVSYTHLDRDYVIKDNKPDVSKVVCQNGQVKLDEIKASGENIWLSGSIEFEVLYTREEVFEGDEPEENIGGNRVEHIKDTIPFQEKLVPVSYTHLLLHFHAAFTWLEKTGRGI